MLPPMQSEHSRSSEMQEAQQKSSTNLNISTRRFHDDIIESLQQNFEMYIQDQSLGTTLRTEIYTSEDEKEMMDYQEFLFDYKKLLPAKKVEHKNIKE